MNLNYVIRSNVDIKSIGDLRNSVGWNVNIENQIILTGKVAYAN